MTKSKILIILFRHPERSRGKSIGPFTTHLDSARCDEKQGLIL